MLKKIAANLHKVENVSGTEFFSYETCIARMACVHTDEYGNSVSTRNNLLVLTDRHYSKTTSKHIEILKKLYPENCVMKGFKP